MAKAQVKDTSNLNRFSVTEWRNTLDTNALQMASAGKQVLDAVLEGRGKVEPDTAREAIWYAFANAHAVASGLTFEEATKCKSVANRVSDAMCIFKCEELPASMPNHLQGAAKACRVANAKPRVPRQPVAKASNDPKSVVDSEDLDTGNSSSLSAKDQTLSILENALKALRSQCGKNQEAKSLVDELLELAESLSAVLSHED